MTGAEVAGRDAAADEAELLARLRAGDEDAFEALVARHYGTMLAVAQTYVKGRAAAEEVVQETWLAVIQGLDRFEGRASLKTWILSILVNKAKTRGVREARSVPFAALAGEDDAPAVAPERFRGAGRRVPGHWRAYPGNWRRDAVVERSRDDPRRDGRHRGAPARAADGDPDARRRGLLLRGGVRGARRERGQPARAAAPRALARPRGARGASRWLTCTPTST